MTKSNKIAKTQGSRTFCISRATALMTASSPNRSTASVITRCVPESQCAYVHCAKKSQRLRCVTSHMVKPTSFLLKKNFLQRRNGHFTVCHHVVHAKVSITQRTELARTVRSFPGTLMFSNSRLTDKNHASGSPIFGVWRCYGMVDQARRPSRG